MKPSALQHRGQLRVDIPHHFVTKLLALNTMLCLFRGPLCLGETDLQRPFFQASRNPLTAIYGVPPSESAKLLPLHTQEVLFSVNVANSFSAGGNDRESVVLDGETWRATFGWRTRVTHQLEIGIDVPWVYHGAGYLDPFINAWHSLWGIAQGDRGSVPPKDFLYQYDRKGKAPVELRRNSKGLGDIRFCTGYEVFSSENRFLTLRLGLKLPTGDAERLMGSGALDGNIGVHYRDSANLGSYSFVYELSGGMVAAGHGKAIPADQRNAVWYGTSTLALPFTSRISGKVQLDSHSGLYQSSLRELGRAAAQLTLGISVSPGEFWILSLAVVEELVVDASPDVGIQFSIRHTIH